MAFTVDPEKFRFDPAFADGVRGKRVLISGAGKDGGMGQAFALAAGLNGASHVGVHFHRSYNDALDLVDVLRENGVNAFPIQADVTNLSDLWATRSYIIEHMGGMPPNLVICNSGLTESGYAFGRTLRPVEGESQAMRRARVRQAFTDNLTESREVVDTKIDGFMGMTHLWSGEAVYAEEPLQVVYVSSRQAIDPGAAVPGYSIANWAVLQLPSVLKVNLGRSSSFVSAFSVLYPFVRTGMTGELVENEKVWGRWQPRMLETHEAAEAFLQALSRPTEETDGTMLEVMVDPDPSVREDTVKVTWKQVELNIQESTTPWSESHPLVY
ncbi:MAG: SDR family NAD(P)-dependent oxidoreductase [Dehalococcoidia bacterium]|nr:SDR family NAD(P)-dependent oxidoreductase [Dehalococcoidia bacterium]